MLLGHAGHRIYGRSLELVKENRLYLPSIFFSFAVVHLLSSRIKQLRFFALVSCAALIVLSTWTHQRVFVWRDPISLLEDSIAKAPQNPRIANELGRWYSRRERFAEAVPLFRRALEGLPWKRSYGHNLLDARRGLRAQERLRTEPDAWAPQLIIAKVLLVGSLEGWHDMETVDRAIAHLEQARRLQPHRPEVRGMLAYARRLREHPEDVRIIH